MRARPLLPGLLLLFWLLLMLSGCAGVAEQLDDGQTIGPVTIQACDEAAQQIRKRLVAHDIYLSAAVMNAQGSVSRNLLSVNRFWASFSTDQLTAGQGEFWHKQLEQQSIQNWQQAIQQLPASSVDKQDFMARVAACHGWLSHVQSVQVEDHYSIWRRVLGLYPVTQLGVRWGASVWRDETQQMLRKGVGVGVGAGTGIVQNSVPEEARVWQQYVPTTHHVVQNATEVAQIIMSSSRNPLNIPQPSATQLQQLLDYHAPSWQVQQGADTSYDQIGRVLPDGSFSQQMPTVYTAYGHTRFNGQNMLQLYYMVWFSERPATRALDIYAGAMDGLIWRVTLQADGEVMLYDTIHSCGCYHLLFPNPELRVKTPTYASEPPIVYPLAWFSQPQVRSQARSQVRLQAEIWLQSGNHYVMAVQPRIQTELPARPPIRLQQRQYAELLPAFSAEGLLPGSERLERWLLWPTGIVSPGQMRALGTQATAFTGKRHFDDAFIYEEFFHTPMAARHEGGTD